VSKRLATEAAAHSGARCQAAARQAERVLVDLHLTQPGCGLCGAAVCLLHASVGRVTRACWHRRREGRARRAPRLQRRMHSRPRCPALKASLAGPTRPTGGPAAPAHCLRPRRLVCAAPAHARAAGQQRSSAPTGLRGAAPACARRRPAACGSGWQSCTAQPRSPRRTAQ